MRGLKKTALNGADNRTWQFYDWINPVGPIKWKFIGPLVVPYHTNTYLWTKYILLSCLYDKVCNKQIWVKVFFVVVPHLLWKAWFYYHISFCIFATFRNKLKPKKHIWTNISFAVLVVWTKVIYISKQKISSYLNYDQHNHYPGIVPFSENITKQPFLSKVLLCTQNHYFFSFLALSFNSWTPC